MFIRKGYLLLLCWVLSISSPAVIAQEIDWNRVEGPSYGTVLSAEKLNSGEIFIGTEKSGVYKSTDAGNSWEELPATPFENAAVWELTVSDGNIYGTTVSGEIWYTEDRGDSWNQIGLPDSIVHDKASPSQIAVDSSEAVYVGFGLPNGYKKRFRDNQGIYGIYKMEEKWDKIDINILKADIIKNLYISPDNHVFATSSDNSRTTLYISKNGGKNWRETKSDSIKPVNMEAYDDKLYALNADGRVWVTADQGSTFSKVVDMKKCADYEYPGYTYFNDMTITEKGRFYFTSEFKSDIFKTDRNGQLGSYDLSDQKCKIIGKHEVALFNMVKTSSNLLVGGFLDGVFNYSIDKKSWSKSSRGVSGSSIKNIGITANRSVILSLQKEYDTYTTFTPKRTHSVKFERTFVSDAESNNWEKLGNTLISSVEGNYDGESTYHINNGKLYESQNILDGISRIEIPLENHSETVSAIESLSDRLLVGSAIVETYLKQGGIKRASGNFYATDTDGRIWYKAGATFGPLKSITSLDQEHLLAFNDSATVIISENGGQDWVHRDMFADVAEEGEHIYALREVTPDVAVASTNLGLFQTPDEGENWNTVYRDISKCELVTDKHNNVYCYSANKALISTDSGSTWKSSTNIFRDRGPVSIEKGEEGYIYAATSSGIYKSSSVHTNINSRDQRITNYSLQEAYPNPFNPTTTISYTIPTSTKVQLEVYNVIGKKVATLVNEYQRAGQYKVKFDGSELSSGVYIYRLTTNGFSQSKRMLLLK